jgi:hypothetical protein
MPWGEVVFGDQSDKGFVDLGEIIMRFSVQPNSYLLVNKKK